VGCAGGARSRTGCAIVTAQDGAPPARTPARAGTPAAAIFGMATKTNRPSEAWTVPLHVVVWTAMIVGFIMVWVVVLMH
jgi:hypothetical protein